MVKNAISFIVHNKLYLSKIGHSTRTETEDGIESAIEWRSTGPEGPERRWFLWN